jgi:hypothetical protein
MFKTPLKKSVSQNFHSTALLPNEIRPASMDPIAKGTDAIPVFSPSAFAQPQADPGSACDTGFWPTSLMALALSSIAIGITWDISWHESIGRDTFWTPAHMAIYFGGVLAGSVAGWLAIQHTFIAKEAGRDSSVSLFGARAPLGAWIAIWGAVAMITSAPFDNWWHNAYGLDVKIISPPHTVLGLGMLGISVGALLLVLSRQNRFPDSSSKGSGLFIFTGGVFVLLGSVFLLEYIFPNEQHGAQFYKVCALMFPARLVAIGRSARVSWPATRIAAIYMGMLCAIDWILSAFPAHPKLAPIFNPITHMVALPFPLLLIVPALAIDLILHKTRGTTGKLRRLEIAVLLGTVFFIVFVVVQWLFSEFMISPRAENWFFMSDRIWSYSSGRGKWHHEFWHLDANQFTLLAVAISWGLACVSSWVGLFFGDWMRKVRR